MSASSSSPLGSGLLLFYLGDFDTEGRNPTPIFMQAVRIHDVFYSSTYLGMFLFLYFFAGACAHDRFMNFPLLFSFYHWKTESLSFILFHLRLVPVVVGRSYFVYLKHMYMIMI